MRYLLILLTLLTMLFTVSANQFSAKQTTAIETIVHDYLLRHPDILTEAMQTQQQQQYRKQQELTLKAAVAHQATLFNAGNTQIAGNPNGSVTLVEFFDYQCVHRAHLYQQGVIADLIRNNPDLRVIYKDYPMP